ncbi:hypothetical protein CsSME_00036967 [Camellia sinensis var. sinensis]
MVFNEVIFQRTLVEASKMLFRYFYYNWPVPTYIQGWLLRYFGFKLIQLGFLYIFPLHLLELFTMIVTVDLTSKLYRGETPSTPREMGQRPIKEARFKAPFITSIHVLYLSTSTILGLTLLVTLYYFISRNIFYGYFFVVAFAAVFAAVLGNYLEVCALCNMRMVISVLERINWAEAIALSDYFRRDSKRHGLFFYACFLCLGIWVTVTMPCFWLLQECGTGGHAGELALDGEMWGNVIKQAAIMIYFYDSKEQTLEVGGEEVVDAEAMDSNLKSLIEGKVEGATRKVRDPPCPTSRSKIYFHFACPKLVWCIAHYNSLHA